MVCAPESEGFAASAQECFEEARRTRSWKGITDEKDRWAFALHKPTPHNSRSFHPEVENHEDASCCRHSCDGDRSPRSSEGEAGEIGAPARLSVVGATRLLPRLPSAGLVPRRVIELLIFGVDGW